MPRVIVLLAVLSACDGPPHAIEPMSVLVFSKTSGFRHASIEPGIQALTEMAADDGWRLVATEDAARFNDASLADLDVVVWLNTSGDVLDPAGQASFERFIHGGGGFVGVHGASDTEYDWPFYGELVAAYFDSHPAVQAADLHRENTDTPATARVPPVWNHIDEWYNFRTNPRANVQVVLSVDETSYEGGTMGDDHPIAWYHQHQGGRAFYSALGHTIEAYAEPTFRDHLAGAITWAGSRQRAILRELDGQHPVGSWTRMEPRDVEFDYHVDRSGLTMTRESDGNQHIVRDGLVITWERPYAIDLDFEIREPTPPGPTSFAINFNQGGADGDHSPVNTMSLNLDIAGAGAQGGVIKYMGFVDGRFAELGDQVVPWGEPHVIYHYRVEVNTRLDGSYQRDMVSAIVRAGGEVLTRFEVDYATFPYQPAPGKPVRFGLNSHGASWRVSNLCIAYLD